MKDEIQTAKIVNEAYLSKYLWSNNFGFQVKSLRHTFTSKCKEQGVLPELVKLLDGTHSRQRYFGKGLYALRNGLPEERGKENYMVKIL